MLSQALIKQLGDAAWQQMSELERQRRVVDLRRKERKLRQDGKKDEIEALIGQHLKHKECEFFFKEPFVVVKTVI